MTFFTIAPPDPEEYKDYQPPSYSDRGHILVEILEINPKGAGYRYELEVHDYSGSAFWINEGMGWEYYFDHYTNPDHIPGPGYYVVEGVFGIYRRGSWGYDDDDEDWEYEKIRPATDDEIKVCQDAGN